MRSSGEANPLIDNKGANANQKLEIEEKIFYNILFNFERMVKRKRMEISEGINPFSPLEGKIMNFLWSNPNSTVAEISRSIDAPLSSVAATIDRLVQHGYVVRKKKKVGDRMKYVYSPTFSREEVRRKMVEDILDTLMEKFGDVVVSYFQRRVGRNG